jgi:hypothetical protein
MMQLRPLKILSMLIWCLAGAVVARAQADTTQSEGEVKKVYALPHQLRFGVDITRPIANLFLKTRQSYEFQVDYAIKNETYLVAEAGWGSANIDYSDLRYKSNNMFLRVGVDKTMLTRIASSDWDMLFVGMRYGFAPIKRSDATYTTTDSLWGNTSGMIQGKSLTAHWLEVTAGIRVEMIQGLFLGWNIHGRFLLNQKPFRELPPSFIAGYGKGDKNTIFDYNFYVSYALRWGRKK